MARKPPVRQRRGGSATSARQENQPRGRGRGLGTSLKDARLGGYLTKATCPTCGPGQTTHLILRHTIECKRCLLVRRRRPGDPAPP